MDTLPEILADLDDAYEALDHHVATIRRLRAELAGRK